jgi:two-component system, LuxR family, response regulator FixJ
MPNEPTVFVVDDDEQARKSVCALVQSMGVNAELFASAEEFLGKFPKNRRGCLVTDLRMLGISGLELQEEMVKRKIFLPVIVLTAFARTPITVRAMKAGAVMVLDKPYNDNDLWDAIRAALAKEVTDRLDRERRQAIRARLASLDSVERKVLDMVLRGMPNKAIAKELDVSVRTIENRRHGIFRKMDVNSVAELIQRVLEAEADFSSQGQISN